MDHFTVFRRGYNSSNNSSRDGGPETVEVGTYEAESEEAAVDAALADGVTVYNGQGIWAELTSVVEARISAKQRRKIR